MYFLWTKTQISQHPSLRNFVGSVIRLKKEYTSKSESSPASVDLEYESKSSVSEIFCLKSKNDITIPKLRAFYNFKFFLIFILYFFIFIFLFFYYQGVFIILVQCFRLVSFFICKNHSITYKDTLPYDFLTLISNSIWHSHHDWND